MNRRYDDFTSAEHTLIVSDIHLADSAEDSDHPDPLWKRFKRPEHFVDKTFKTFLDTMQSQINGSIELILNGDIFDFDSVMRVPEDSDFKVTWLERRRGLSSEEKKSRFKMKIILEAHHVWVETLREFILKGNRVIFVIGNHDMELHWPSVQSDVVEKLKLPDEKKGLVRFCEWFYLSNQDTLVEHGNQYDSYCLCSNPIHPLIKIGSSVLVRLPFGNLAGKYMINGIGLMNPHATGSYIKSSLWEYIQFYYKYMMRTQPFLLWTWLWSAFITLVYSLSEGFLPALRDPLTVDARIEDIAQRSNASVLMVLSLKEVHVHPAIFSPLKILRELWLDRALFLLMIFGVSLQFFSLISVFTQVSLWWFIVPLGLLLPIFIFYARSVQSEVERAQEAALELAPLSARITKVRRLVQGHTHIEEHRDVNGLELMNTGTWSPAFHDAECTQPYGRKCFAWIKPASSQRTAELYEWKDPTFIKIDRRVS